MTLLQGTTTYSIVIGDTVKTTTFINNTQHNTLMRIIYTKKYAIQTPAQAIINSANGYLLHDSGGAGKIRQSACTLTTQQSKDYNKMLKKLPLNVSNLFINIAQQHQWKPTQVILASLRILNNRNGKPLSKGTALLDPYWSPGNNRICIHAIAMSYKANLHSRKRIPATPWSVRMAVRKSLQLAQLKKCDSVALPVLCARATYGITTTQSLAIIEQELKETSLQKCYICFDNTTTRKWLDKKQKKETKSR